MKANYFKVGIFVLVAVAILVIGVVGMGLDLLFAQAQKAVTYAD